jgi:NADPH:quinone reductase-like Zn-dependent oxidoreductase
MSRAVVYEQFGGPEVLDLREVPEPHAGAGEVRVRVTAAGLNPMDWLVPSMPEAAARFGVSLPSGFGCDLAGVVDEVGEGVDGFTVGDRVYGGVFGRAAADFAIVPVGTNPLFQITAVPDGLDDVVAAALPTPGLTAAAALDAISVGAGDVVLVGGAAGGVGVLTVQLARRAGARVIGTASPGTFDFLRGLGAEPVAYGPGLAARVRALAPEGITAATDMFGVETAEAALELGVAPERISTIAADNPPWGVRATGGFHAKPGALGQIAASIVVGEVTLPIAATFPLEQIHDAIALQAGRHVHGKIVVTM